MIFLLILQTYNEQNEQFNIFCTTFISISYILTEKTVIHVHIAELYTRSAILAAILDLPTCEYSDEFIIFI